MKHLFLCLSSSNQVSYHALKNYSPIPPTPCSETILDPSYIRQWILPSTQYAKFICDVVYAKHYSNYVTSLWRKSAWRTKSHRPAESAAWASLKSSAAASETPTRFKSAPVREPSLKEEEYTFHLYNDKQRFNEGAHTAVDKDNDSINEYSASNIMVDILLCICESVAK